MKNYFLIELKRMLRLLPFVLIATLVLLVCAGIIVSNVFASNSSREDNTVSRFAICGDTEGTYLNMGFSALETLDSTKFTLSLEMMEEAEARKLLADDKITAFIIIPENFAEEAYYGNILPITYVCNDDTAGLTVFFKDELTKIISQSLCAGLKSAYGTLGALDDANSENTRELTNRMALEYTDLILSRSDTYKVEELGISNALSLPGYFFCGLGTLLMLLAALPFSVLYVRRDLSLRQIMLSKDYGARKQIFSEFYGLFIGLGLVFTFAAVAVFFAEQFSSLPISDIIITEEPILAFIYALPIVLMFSAMSLLIFEISKSLVSGVLLHFITTLLLCYVTGCFYPIFVFPEIIQEIAQWLPTGIARRHLEGCITEENVLLSALLLILYCAVFLSIVVLLRRLKLKRKG